MFALSPLSTVHSRLPMSTARFGREIEGGANHLADLLRRDIVPSQWDLGRALIFALRHGENALLTRLIDSQVQGAVSLWFAETQQLRNTAVLDLVPGQHFIYRLSDQTRAVMERLYPTETLPNREATVHLCQRMV